MFLILFLVPNAMFPLSALLSSHRYVITSHSVSPCLIFDSCSVISHILLRYSSHFGNCSFHHLCLRSILFSFVFFPHKLWLKTVFPHQLLSLIILIIIIIIVVILIIVVIVIVSMITSINHFSVSLIYCTCFLFKFKVDITTPYLREI